MSDPSRPTEAKQEEVATPEDLGHPRGTLAIVALFGLLFGLGWLAMYLLRFLPAGAPHP
jgi:hypothetical protein